MLFNSFTQVDASTSRQYGGTGLGLAIAKQLSMLMGGNISAKSIEGNGSTFHFHILLTSSKDTPESPALPHIREKHIVVIDDNIDVTNCFKNSLHNQQANLQCFNSTNVAKQYLENINTQKVDLIIIDINMPNKNGVQLTKEIKSLDALKKQ